MSFMLSVASKLNMLSFIMLNVVVLSVVMLNVVESRSALPVLFATPSVTKDRVISVYVKTEHQ